MPFEPRGVESVRILHWQQGAPFPVEDLAKLVYCGLTYSKQARVAIMGDPEPLNQIPEHLAKNLDPRRNYHWSGAEYRVKLERHLPRVLAGEYAEWFQWYMRFQRFKAFQTVILIDPLSAVTDIESGGFVDGLLSRLMAKVPQVVVVTKNGAEQAPIRADELHIKAVLLSLLYGTRMSRARLIEAAKLTFVALPEQKLQENLDGSHWQMRLSNSRYELTEDDEELVQRMVPRWKSSGPESDEIEQLFQRHRKREYIRPETEWVENEVLKVVKTAGWFTTQSLEVQFQERYAEFASSGVPPPKEVYPYSQREYLTEAQIFRPSPSIVRRVSAKLVAEGRLKTHRWYREIGRTALVYTEPGGAIPFIEGMRCGQCAFYLESRRLCRIWSLARWKYQSWGFKWEGPGVGINPFEKYKMDNSHRVGPHSSACKLFLDKKRDHLRKRIPDTCEVCAAALKPRAGKAVLCSNCRTVYSPWNGKVMVKTGYEHEFQRRYKELTGSEAEEDRRNQREEWPKSPQRDWEKMIPLPPKELSSVERSKPEPGPWPKPTFSPALQHLVDERARTTEIAKQLSLAMVQSAINATKSLALVRRLESDVLEEALRRQERCLSMIKASEVGRLHPYEAQAMKEYWACYDSALKPAQQWFGPRVRYRFVSEFVYDLGGSAKGYSALHAAINYLHQRRLRQAERINQEFGFSGTCDGFLHRKHYNPTGMGLLFDMIDPFKFADREELLAVVLNRDITWRDFKMDSDRYNSTFYYPASSGIATLDQVGADADQLIVRYVAIESSLTEAYKRFANSFLSALGSSKAKIEPFVYAPALNTKS